MKAEDVNMPITEWDLVPTILLRVMVRVSLEREEGGRETVDIG